MAILGAYLYFESRNHDIKDYMKANWIGWPTDLNDKMALKAKIKECA